MNQAEFLSCCPPNLARRRRGRPSRADQAQRHAPPQTSPAFEMVAVLDRSQAFLLPQPMDRGMVQILFGLGGRNWRADVHLANRWGLWAVLADPGWAAAQIERPRPKGTWLLFPAVPAGGEVPVSAIASAPILQEP